LGHDEPDDRVGHRIVDWFDVHGFDVQVRRSGSTFIGPMSWAWFSYTQIRCRYVGQPTKESKVAHMSSSR
ncbi:hypothetical protein, partial [Mycobacteroides abscessus]|uniref:hypothetical protein n=1 Tax=Mycobacteroides abscessus TaxID=36809 RepID=UPI001A93239F